LTQRPWPDFDLPAAFHSARRTSSTARWASPRDFEDLVAFCAQ